MNERPRLLVIGPHPDDESVFLGGTLAKYARQGIDINLLVLSNGEKGRIPLLDSQGQVIGARAVEPEEEPWLGSIRQGECLEAAGILGIQKVEFLNLPNLGIDQQVIPSLVNKIRTFDPHVVISFNEAGTTLNQDHSWSGIAAFAAVASVLKEDHGRHLALRRLLTYTLPDADKYLEKWAELVLPAKQHLAVEVSDFSEIKRQASFAHRIQRHLIDFFDRLGILSLPQEHFAERIWVGESCLGQGDIFYGLDRPREPVCFTLFPERRAYYTSTVDNFADVVYQRYNTVYPPVLASVS